jgi:hypothetical protein
MYKGLQPEGRRHVNSFVQLAEHWSIPVYTGRAAHQKMPHRGAMDARPYLYLGLYNLADRRSVTEVALQHGIRILSSTLHTIKQTT